MLLFSGRLYRGEESRFSLERLCAAEDYLSGSGAANHRRWRRAKKTGTVSNATQPPRCAFLGRACRAYGHRGVLFSGGFDGIPGLVGLAIVHGFAFGLALHTTNSPGHGPELDYLSGKNGVISRHDISHYAEAIASLLFSPQRLEAMKQAAMAQGDELQLHHSVHRFVDGITTFSQG